MALIIAGCTNQAIPVLQSYLNETGDIQRVGLLSIVMKSQNSTPDLIEWANMYKDTLNKLELWQTRCKLDIDENELSPIQREKAKQFKCYYCGSSLALNELVPHHSANRRAMNQHHIKPFINHCSVCMNLLPRCVTCLLPYNSINPYFEIARSFRTMHLSLIHI